MNLSIQDLTTKCLHLRPKKIPVVPVSYREYGRKNIFFYGFGSFSLGDL